MKPLLFPALMLVAGMTVATAQEASAPAAVLAAPAKPMVAADPALLARIAEVKDPALLTQLIAQLRQKGDTAAELAALDRRITLRPHLGIYRLDKAVTLAREDRKSEAYTALIELQNTGYAYDLRNDPRFAKIATTEVWQYICENFDANRAAFGGGVLAYTLPREDLLLESIAYDPGRDTLLAGSAREGKVYVVGADGKIQPLAAADAENGMWAVLDLAVDAKRDVLWVASTAMPHFKRYDAQKDLGRAGIFKFDLKTGKFIKSFLSPPPEAGQPFWMTSIAVADDGSVYAVDGVNRAVYQVRDDQFRRILHLPMLTSIAALTASTDGKLYLADPQLGILGVDLATLELFDVRVPPKLSLEGIASLHYQDRALYAVQAGMNPQRVMRFDLSPDGSTITQVHPLEASNPKFGRPGAMTMKGSMLFVVANDQKDRYDRFGLLKDKDALEGTRILRISANYVAVDPNRLGPLDFKQFEEQQED